jgi:hypothetical protein
MTDPALLGERMNALVERLHTLRRSIGGGGIWAQDVLAASAPLTVHEISPGTQAVLAAERGCALPEREPAKIGADIHYPRHQLHSFAHRRACDGLLKSERFAEKILSLPILPGITKVQQARAAGFLKCSVSVNLSGASS